LNCHECVSWHYPSQEMCCAKKAFSNWVRQKAHKGFWRTVFFANCVVHRISLLWIQQNDGHDIVGLTESSTHMDARKFSSEDLSSKLSWHRRPCSRHVSHQESWILSGHCRYEAFEQTRNNKLCSQAKTCPADLPSSNLLQNPTARETS
jgi:hypothetical protein